MSRRSTAHGHPLPAGVGGPGRPVTLADLQRHPTDTTPNPVPALQIRRALGREAWGIPVEFGPAGWRFDSADQEARILVTLGPTGDSDDEWLHASISRRDAMPTYDDLTHLHRAVWPNGWAYQVFAPPAAHINIHAHALHLWGRPDGAPLLPNFGAFGTI